MSDALWEDTVTRWYNEGLPREAASEDVFQGSGGIANSEVSFSRYRYTFGLVRRCGN
jgi:hypothetical protein